MCYMVDNIISLIEYLTKSKTECEENELIVKLIAVVD